MKAYIINTKASNQTDLLYAISEFAEKKQITTSVNRLLKAFSDREKEFSTAFEHGIAIPHARIKEIKESAIIIARNSKGVDWTSLDGKPTDCAIALLIEGSENAGNEHMEVLAHVSGLLLDKKNIDIFKTGTQAQIDKLIAKKDVREETNEDYYDFVAVTSCPTGVAHTNMAGEALERFAKENNLKVKVERQAAQGTVNRITMEDMAKTKHVILAIGRSIDGMERFDGKQLVQVGVAAPMKDSAKLWKDVQDANVYVSRVKPGANKNSGSSVGKVSIMAALMTGLSYMIPIVIVGGIFLAFGLGIGRIAVGGDVTDGTHNASFWYAIFNIGVVGINLAVVILGGFVAQAIGGRLALAPALIISAACQGVGMVTGGSLFFNYETGGFGVNGSNLSFFGSIAAGLLFGYAAKYWTIYVSPKIPKALKTVEPIIIVPILFVFLGWILFGFVLYLPLYYLSVGLNKGVEGLVNNNILWVAGAVGGAMLCFDLGGPVNKIAFGTGVAMLDKTGSMYHPEVMGAIAAAGSVGPVGMAFGWLIGAKLFKIDKLRNDDMLKDSFVPALFMGFVGISEGAIPYAIKNPKTAIFSNVIGGAIAGAISGAFLITDTAAHTGPIVWVLGAVGRNGTTDYLYGLLYIMAFAIGSVATAFLFAGLELWFDRRRKSGKKEVHFNLFKKENKNESSNFVKTKKDQVKWEGYAWNKIKHFVNK